MEIFWSPAEARDRLAAFRQRYNEVRPHWALVPTAGGDPVTLAEVYRGQTEVPDPGLAGLGQGRQGQARRPARPRCREGRMTRQSHTTNPARSHRTASQGTCHT